MMTGQDPIVKHPVEVHQKVIEIVKIGMMKTVTETDTEVVEKVAVNIKEDQIHHQVAHLMIITAGRVHIQNLDDHPTIGSILIAF